MANCSVNQLEISPLIALLNMIKDNYFDRPEVFHTLLAVLHDYNHNQSSAAKAMKYILLLLSDKKELSQCLLSLLPLKSVPDFERKVFSMDSLGNSMDSTLQNTILQQQTHCANNASMQRQPIVIMCNNCFSPIIFYSHELSASPNCVCQSAYH